MPVPALPRPARARRTVTGAVLLSTALTAGLALTSGLTLTASAAPENPLVPEITTPEMHPVGPRVAERLARLERIQGSTTAPALPRSGAVTRTAAAVAAVAKPITSKSFTGFAFPGCPSAGGSATLLAAVHARKTRTLRWVLTNDGSVTKTGRLQVKGHKSAQKMTEFSVAGLPVGAYHLDFRKSGSSKVSVRLPVLVLECVQATATCRGVSFANPAGNPAVELDYGPAGDDEGDGGFFTLRPGQSRAVRTDSLAVVWSAYGMTRQTQSSAGEALSVTVPQACPPPDPVPGDHALISYGLADCFGTGADGARLELEFDRRKDIAVRFELRNAANAVVLHGEAGTQVEAIGYLPASGPYRYRTYLNGSATAYEDLAFTVLDCVRVRRTCKSATFTNPNPVRLEVDYATKTGKHDRQLTLAGGAAKKLRWKYQSLSWFGYPPGTTDEPTELGPHIFSIAGNAEQPRPASC